MLKYEATSLADIADMFDAQAEQAKKAAGRSFGRTMIVEEARANTWTEAARILRSTTLIVPPVD